LKTTYLPADTAPEALRVQFCVWRRQGIAGRARAAFALNDEIRRQAAEGIRRRHPHYDDDEVRLALLRRILGDRLFGEAFPGVQIDP
jgi:hypothetical protein